MISLVWRRCDAILRARSNFNFRGEARRGEKFTRSRYSLLPFPFFFLFYKTSLYREIPRPDDNFLLEVGGKRGKRWRKEGEETDTGIFLPGRESRREGSWWTRVNKRNYGQHNLAGQISAVLTAVNFRALTVKNARGAILSKHSCGRVYKLSRAFNKWWRIKKVNEVISAFFRYRLVHC